jgi:hypothetical protein
MTPSTNRILKSDQVEVEGKLALDLGCAAPSGQIKNAPAGIAKVRILENQIEYAVMEVTCSCGRKTVIRCDYGGGSAAIKSSDARPQQSGSAPRNPEKKP